jgi:hypothetical protein
MNTSASIGALSFAMTVPTTATFGACDRELPPNGDFEWPQSVSCAWGAIQSAADSQEIRGEGLPHCLYLHLDNASPKERWLCECFPAH